MATITKWYFHDVASPNLGTMPGSGTPCKISLASDASTGDASGARTARDATGTIGTANPDTESTLTSNADTLIQRWGHRRFISRPLAGGQSNYFGGSNWTWSYARTESNLNHNQIVKFLGYLWNPFTNALADGSANLSIAGTEPTSAGAEQAETRTGAGVAGATIQEGWVFVFDITTDFQQAMATAYTEQFAYDGTTEGSTTTCASFIQSPAAITLSDNPWPKNAAINFQDPAVLMKAFGFKLRNWLWRPLKRPSLWTPELWRPEIWLPDHVAQGEIAV